jgi:nitrite reductase (NADH) small subunit
MMNLSRLVTDLDIEAGQRWSVLGLDTQDFESVLAVQLQASFLLFEQKNVSEIDGVLLFGALSTSVDPLGTLGQVTESLTEGSTVLVVDWQADGPLNIGPALERRVKKGRVRRHLKETGFGIIELLAEHPLYYVVKGVKGPAPPIPHANEYVDVASLNDLPRNTMKQVEIFGHKIVVANTGQEVVAFDQACPHANGPFDKGLLRGRNVVCPLHSYIWNVCTGEPVEPADEDTLRRYSVKIDTVRSRVLVALSPP